MPMSTGGRRRSEERRVGKARRSLSSIRIYRSSMYGRRATIWTSFFFSSRRRHTRYWRDWSSDVCSSDLRRELEAHRECEARPIPRDRDERLIEAARRLEQNHQVDLAAHDAYEHWRATEIGRASCRESKTIIVVNQDLQVKHVWKACDHLDVIFFFKQKTAYEVLA